MIHSGPTQARRPAQSGIALVLVLWVVALLSTMALAMVAAGRTESQSVRNRIDEVRFRALADAAVAYTMLRLTATEEADHWEPDGVVREWVFDGIPLEIQVLNESSLLDLNGASDQMLSGLLEAAGLVGAERDRMLAAIKDWRDADSAADALGAEDQEYRAAGLPYGSKDERFETVEELRQVLGMTDELFHILYPNLTAYSEGVRFNPYYAPPLVKAVLGVDAAADTDPRSAGAGQKGAAGPNYRIRIAGGAEYRGPGMEMMVAQGSRRGAAFSVRWRRLSWSGPGQ